MSKLKSLYKRYERPLMLGLVIVLLATFSITGAFVGCFEQAEAPLQHNHGGTFALAPGEEATLSDREYDDRLRQLHQYMRAVGSPSFKWGQYLSSGESINGLATTWHHVATTEAAKEAGFQVGEEQIKEAVRTVIGDVLRMPITDVNYQVFLRERFHGKSDDFKRLLAEVIRKDEFLSSAIESARYAQTWPEAYEASRRDLERVDLEYVALSGDPFAEEVRAEETSRAAISELEERLNPFKAAYLRVRRTDAEIDRWRKGHAEDALPADMDALVAAKALTAAPLDPWGQPLRYVVTGEDTWRVSSSGPDKAPDTADDVSLDAAPILDTLGRLSQVAAAAHEYHGGKEAWPADVAALREPLEENQLPPLKGSTSLDGWGNEVRLVPASGDGRPSVTSNGPDGIAGNADDITVPLEGHYEKRTLAIPVATWFAEWVGAPLDDAWGTPVQAGLHSADPLVWVVRSAGPDRTFGTEDDLHEGNLQGLRDFHARSEIKSRYREEAIRRFEVLFVHLPLLPDAQLRKMWERYPQHHPTSEEQLFQDWKLNRETIYVAEEPGHAENGHGAELAAKIAPDATPILVPDASIFPASLDPATDEGGEEKDGEGEGEDKEEDDAGEDGLDLPDPDAELRETWRTSGWRAVLIRQRFMENLLQDVLGRILERESAIETWDQEHGAAEEGAPVPPRPLALDFQTLLATELDPFQTGAAQADQGLQAFRYYRTQRDEGEDPESRWGDTAEDWQEHPDFGDPTFSAYLSGRIGENEYIDSTVQVNRRATKALVRNLEFLPARDPDLEDIRERVLTDYVGKRQVDRAVEALKELQESVPAPEEGQEESAREAAWVAAVDAWAKAHGHPYLRERSGLFIGAIPPEPMAVDEDDQSEEAQRLRRRNFIWRRGYDTVRPLGSLQDPTQGKPGTFGRTPQKDDPVSAGGTGMAYLIRVAERTWPTEAEFSPQLYAASLFKAAWDHAGSRRIQDRPGAWWKALWHHFLDKDSLEEVWRLRTNEPLEGAKAFE